MTADVSTAGGASRPNDGWAPARFHSRETYWPQRHARGGHKICQASSARHQQALHKLPDPPGAARLPNSVRASAGPAMPAATNRWPFGRFGQVARAGLCRTAGPRPAHHPDHRNINGTKYRTVQYLKIQILAPHRQGVSGQTAKASCQAPAKNASCEPVRSQGSGFWARRTLHSEGLQDCKGGSNAR